MSDATPNGDGAPFLEVRDVYKSYGDKLVLDNIDLTVAKGELCCVIGPSGCGKSTLLRLILGQERVTGGEIRIEGGPVGWPGVDRGVVYQRYSLFPHLTVLENVTLGRRLRCGWLEFRKRRAEFEEEANGYLAEVGLTGHGHKHPHELSGGMQQRVAVAQSLILQPKILLMDEPFGALDPSTREDVQLFLLELWETHGMTIFFVTHDLEEAAFLGSRLLVLSQYYRDDRGVSAERGAKIVSDQRLHAPGTALSTRTKQSDGFSELVARARQAGFDPEHLQHAREFDLAHPDSVQTLTSEEDGRGD
ncbi:MAG: ABC transporter ATP-binding protein [Myxococcota bacterium]|nr:ABC transporter ATP-binding protein [Myxococcota bacterium]